MVAAQKSNKLSSISKQEKVERQLRESEQRYRALFEFSGDAIMILTEDSFVDCNQATLDIFKYKRTEFIGKHPSEVSPAKQPNGESSTVAANKHIAKAVKTGKDFFEWTHRRGDGTDFPAEVLLTPVVISAKKLIQATVRDISERKKQETQLSIYASIFENTEDAILSKDLKGTILTWNKAAEKLYQYTSKETIGRNISLILPDDRKNEVENILARIAKGERIEHFETIRLKKDETKVEVSLTVSPIKDSSGKIIGASSIARDITKQKEKTEELEMLNRLMVGRELKMIELKERIKQLENQPTSKPVSKIISWAERFKEGINLEEGVILKLKSTFISEIKKSYLSQDKKKESLILVNQLISDSQRHKDCLEKLIGRKNGE